MRIIKFGDFINENFNDIPEEYIKTALTKIKKKIESFFQEEESGQSGAEAAIERGKNKENKDISFSDLGIKLQSSEFSNFSSNNDNVVIKFSDEEYMYNLFISIPLENAQPNPDEDFSDKDIKKCYIKFKKYDLDEFDICGQVSKNINIDDITEEFLVDLKIELDEEFGEEDDKLEIEY